MLHCAAKVVVEEHEGYLSCRAEDLRELPGIGRYTANAIASIAFNQPVAVVDGNVERVLSRLLNRQLAGEVLWRTAQGILDPEQPGDFNQAMMELGATVCLPGVPRCSGCPVNRLCASRGRRRKSSRAVEQRSRRSASLLLVRRRNSVLLRQRSTADRLMAGMWELPETEIAPNRDPVLTVKHSITTTDWSVNVFTYSHIGNKGRSRWVSLSKVTRLPLTGLTRKILRRLNLIA
jgi:A/G-specific adenine glycosylase